MIATLIATVALAAGGLGACAGPAQPRAATTTAVAAKAAAAEWQVAYATHGGPSKSFYGITAPAKDDAWAVGNADAPDQTDSVTSIFAHWNGKAWSGVTIKAGADINFGLTGPDLQPYAAFSSSPANVWFFGLSIKAKAEVAVVYNGKTWRVKPLPSDFKAPLAVLGPGNVWAISTKKCRDCTVLTHWNGTIWSDVMVKGDDPNAATAGGHAWIVTHAGRPVLYQTTRTAISQVTGKEGSLLFKSGEQLAAAPDGQLWITGFGGTKDRLYHWTGTEWTQSPIPSRLCSPVDPGPPYEGSRCVFNYNGNVSYDGHGGLWFGNEARWTGGKWINIFDTDSKPLRSGFSAAQSVPIPGTDSAWAAADIYDRGWPVGLGKFIQSDAGVAVYGPLP